MPLSYSFENCLGIESAPLSPSLGRKYWNELESLKHSCAKETTRSRHKDITWCGEQ